MANATTPADIERYRGHLQAEVDGAALYFALAEAEDNPNRAEVLRRLAETEQRHAAHWAEQIRAAGGDVVMPVPGRYTRFLGFIARRFGARSVLPIARAMEMKGSTAYAAEPAAGNLAADERVHARTVIELAAVPATTGAGAILGRERWHRARDSGGSFRAAIFGVNDGLVSNLSLVMGVAGADPGNRFVLLSGIAGLLAGSFSMAAGEYVSMTAQREMFERQIALEKEELEANPEEEQEELSLIYQAKGIPRAQADALAASIISNPQTALDTLAREELGLDPASLGSPWGAALSSFIMFSLGAIVPVLAFLFSGGVTAIVISALLGALALFSVGAALSLFTGRAPLRSGLRMLAIGLGASAITFLVGRVIGVSVT